MKTAKQAHCVGNIHARSWQHIGPTRGILSLVAQSPRNEYRVWWCWRNHGHATCLAASEVQAHGISYQGLSGDVGLKDGPALQLSSYWSSSS